MIVHIIREACCSQDDQLGPLEIQLEFDENVTLEQVIKEICTVKFLQYSSSHNHMIGTADDQKIVEILLGVVCGRGRNPTLRLWPTIFSGKIDVFPGDRRSRLISSMTSVAPA